jgi:hypothetical protein
MHCTRPNITPTGETVARAKRTDRANARRRYRAEMAGTEGFDEEGAPVAAGPTPAPSKARPAPSKGTTSNPPPGRLGIGEAFRRSIHPLNIRGDLRDLPKLVTNKALWLPAALTIGSTILVFATGADKNFMTALLYTYFVQSPAIGGVFLAGFLAPRASWLLGVLVGLLSAACYTAIILSGTLGAPTESARDVIVAAFLLSPVMGGLFAAGAAWYRRFLQLSSPNRGKQPPPKKAGNDGRSRSSGAAKTR